MIQNEVYVFLWSIIVGSILALIFDFFRLMRRKGNTKNLVVYIQDIIYWLIVAIIIIISAFITNDGELRGFMFIGYIIGAIFYLFLFSKFFLRIFGTILDFVENIGENCNDFVKKIVSRLKFKKKNVKV